MKNFNQLEQPTLGNNHRPINCLTLAFSGCLTSFCGFLMFLDVFVFFEPQLSLFLSGIHIVDWGLFHGLQPKFHRSCAKLKCKATYGYPDGYHQGKAMKKAFVANYNIRSTRQHQRPQNPSEKNRQHRKNFMTYGKEKGTEVRNLSKHCIVFIQF